MRLSGPRWSPPRRRPSQELSCPPSCPPLLPAVTRDRLITLNPRLVTSANVADVLHRLRTVRADMRGNEHFLRALRGHWTVYDEAEKRERNLTLLAYDDLSANRFTFTQEFKFEGRDVRRADMILFVNGLPLVIIENKSPTRKEPELEAFDQVQHTYTDRIPELLKFTQAFAACDTRIGVAVPSCYFCTFEGSIGTLHHCECNYVPGIMTVAEMYDVAGLTAPRPFLAVAGREDGICPYPAVEQAFAKLSRIYEVAGVPERCRLSTGEGGHRYYKRDVWPFIEKAFAGEL